MKKGSIILVASVLGIVVIAAIIFFILNSSEQSLSQDKFTNLKLGIIKFSEPQGDEVYDSRIPLEVCSSMLKQIENLNSNLKCSVLNSTRINSSQNLEEECSTGYSIAGCFSCIFDCK